MAVKYFVVFFVVLIIGGRNVNGFNNDMLKVDKRLSSPKLDLSQATNLEECFLQCKKDPQCKAFNFNIFGLHDCEKLSTVAKEKDKLLHTEGNWVYYDMRNI